VKIFSVQYLRGLAATMVVVAHSMMHPQRVPSTDLERMASMGVLMFFVISGFIMVFISGEGRFAPGTFLKRRALRVVPLYWIMTVLVAIVAIAAPHLLKTSVYTHSHFLLSLLFIPHYDSAGVLAPLLKLGWTLNFEMFFYFCFAALAFLGATARVVVLSLVFAVLIALGLIFDFTNAFAHFYTGYVLGAFCVGTWIGLATIRGLTIKGSPALQGLFALLTVGFLAAGFLLDHGTRGGFIVTYCLALSAACLLVLGIGMEDRVPVLRVPMLLGDASYSLYLVHMYVVGVVITIGHRLLPSVPLALLVMLTIAAAIVAGIVLHKLVEMPLLALLQRRKAGPPASATTSHLPEQGKEGMAFDNGDNAATVAGEA
jgi:exopolysaccharide production protein ExoZ